MGNLLKKSAGNWVKKTARSVNSSMVSVCVCVVTAKHDCSLFSLTLTHTEKQIDWTSIDLGKLRVKELKKILNDWGESCRGCAEKRDFIEKIDQLKPHHVEL